LSRLARLWRDRSGASTLLTVLMLPVLLGFTAFAVDGGMAYVTRRNAQGAADSAAHSAAIAAANGDANLADQAKAVALQYGLTDGQAGVSIRVNSPPTSGPYAGNAKAVEVIVSRPMLTFFSQMFGGTASTLTVRSVSLIGRAGDVCVLALNPTKQYAVLVNGQPVITLTDCALQINSNAAQGLLVNGGAKITADQIRLVGAGYLLNGGPTMTLKNGFKTGADAIPDPYAGVTVPATTPCKALGTVPSSGNWTVPTTPGGVTTFCADVTLNGSQQITFPPGVYIFTNGADLTINGTSAQTVTGNGVTFVFARSGTTTGALTINGTQTLNLTAPSGGPTAGLIVFTDPSVTTQPMAVLNGSSSSQLTGAIHLPKAQVTINGANAIKGDCLQLVADNVTYNGSSGFGLDCAGVGVKPIGLLPSNLVE
jgi:Flp pilus assembly protein TadG